MDQLRNDFREVIVLRDLLDLSYRQIAGTLGTTIPTVKARLDRARLALRQVTLAVQVRRVAPRRSELPA